MNWSCAQESLHVISHVSGAWGGDWRMGMCMDEEMISTARSRFGGGCPVDRSGYINC